MKRLLIFGWLILSAAGILTVSMCGQVEHAPTVAQCQADQRLWSSQIERSASTLTFDVLKSRGREMIECYDVDPANAKDYYTTASSATAVTAARLSKFIQRHQLWDKFIAEDAAGKR